MWNAAKAKELASRLLDAVNAHDVERIVACYAEDAELESPVVVTMMNEPSGKIRGREALRTYFKKGIAQYPYMSMHLIQAAYGVNSITAWYVNHQGSRTNTYLELDAEGKVTRNVTHYNE
jgi:ketosteroid isomerase-like protein